MPIADLLLTELQSQLLSLLAFHNGYLQQSNDKTSITICCDQLTQVAVPISAWNEVQELIDFQLISPLWADATRFKLTHRGRVWIAWH